MDLRTRTSLFCGALALAICLSSLLRRRPSVSQLWFAGFAANTGLWYLAQWLYLSVGADVWARSTALLAVLLPQFALPLFASLIPEPDRRVTLPRAAAFLLVPIAGLVLLGPLGRWWVRWIVFAYVLGLLTWGLGSLWARALQSRSRITQRRVRFLVAVGALAVMASLADFLWFLDVRLPPFGAALSVLFLFITSESLLRQRFVDLYEVVGQVTLSVLLASCLAAIFYVFIGLFGGFDTMYLGAFLATIVILVVSEPLREKATQAVHRLFFRERADLERAVRRVQIDLQHVLDLDDCAQVILAALEASRRVTAAALYLRDPLDAQLRLLGAIGPEPAQRIDLPSVQPLVSCLEQQTTVILDDVAHQAHPHRPLSKAPDSADQTAARLLAAAESLGPFRRGIVLALPGPRGALTGLLLLADDRATDAFAPDEILLLEEMALHASVAVENSRQFRRLQVRDRLAVLGQMAAGLAHEVKNPLGAIKGAAQLLGHLPEPDREFVSIILEEVDRLDRVVGSVLDYARPATGTVRELDLRHVLERTARMLETAEQRGRVSVTVEEGLPPVRADAEQLRQVLLNLIQNALQAMGGTGVVRVSASSLVRGTAVGSEPWVQVCVQDDGPGIAPEVMKSLFVPFVTTKPRGTGLGLAISQRIVEEMGGRIDVTSAPGMGATFTVRLPAPGPATAGGEVGDAPLADYLLEPKPNVLL